MKNDILVIVAHADDEALGCGATIARHAHSGDTVHLMVMTDGVSARKATSLEIDRRNNALRKSAEILGVNQVFQYDFSDNKMDSAPLLEIVRVIEDKISQIRPNIIYTHSASDLNIDHQIVNRAVLTATRPVPQQSVKKILAIEILSSTNWTFSAGNQFLPNVFINVADHIDKKILSLQCYNEEMRDFPHERSVEAVMALSKLRGATVGCLHAEAFNLIREIF